MKNLLLAIAALTMVLGMTGPSLAQDGRGHQGYRQGYHAPTPFLAFQFKQRHAHRYGYRQGYRHGHRHYRPHRWHRSRGYHRGWRNDRRGRGHNRGNNRRDRNRRNRG